MVLDTVGWEIPNSSAMAAWARLRRRYINTAVTALPRSRQAGRPPPPLVVTPAALSLDPPRNTGLSEHRAASVIDYAEVAVFLVAAR